MPGTRTITIPAPVRLKEPIGGVDWLVNGEPVDYEFRAYVMQLLAHDLFAATLPALRSAMALAALTEAAVGMEVTVANDDLALLLQAAERPVLIRLPHALLRAQVVTAFYDGVLCPV